MRITILLWLLLMVTNAGLFGQEPSDPSIRSIAATRLVDVPLVIGHRGASGYLPEHTTESAAMAHALGTDFIEQDCVLTRDGVPVVLHDMTLEDVTDVAAVFPARSRENGRWYVMDFSLAELRTLRLTERRSESRAWKNAATRFPLEQGSFRISTLEEHLQLIQGLNRSRPHRAGVYVEVKDPAQHRAAGLDASVAILDVLQKYGYTNPDDAIFVQCFDAAEVIRIRTELDCRLPLIQLLSDLPTASEVREYSRVADGLGVPVTTVVSGCTADGAPVISDLVRQAHENAMQVHVWTFRTDALPGFAADADQLLKWLILDAGVDGIFADQPDVVLDWRAVHTESAQRRPRSPFRLLAD